MIPSQIQTQLQQFYDLELPHQVNDFLITDRALANRLEDRPTNHDVKEKLLVLQQSEGLEISLFLAEDLLASLNRNNPFDNLNDKNLSEYCTALEGVSHFVYLAWNATHDRSVSQLELELQAEVDKFVSLVLLATEQGNSMVQPEISKLLFSDCQFDSSLSPEELERYQSANQYALTFCSKLAQRNPGPICSQGTRNELRRFYRKRHLEKLSNCENSIAITAP